MNEDSARAEEERILRTMSRKPGAPAPRNTNRMSVNVAGTATTTPARSTTAAVLSSRTSEPNLLRPANLNANAAPVLQRGYSSTLPVHSELAELQIKKKTVLGNIVTTRRDLEDVRAEIAKLKAREAELASLLEKREAAVQQLNTQIEEAEQSESSEKSNAEENRRRAEEEKARRVREENERRRREEEEEERKKREAEEERRRQTVVNSPAYYGGQPAARPRAATAAVGLQRPPTTSTPQQGRQLTSQEAIEEGVDPEELRLMRAMSRKPGAAGTNNRASMYNPPVAKVVPQAKPQQEPAWKEQERSRETERLARATEDNRRKEEERRVTLDLQNQARISEEQHIAAIQSRGGDLHTFTSPTIYDFEADVKICGDFTDWREVPITSEMDKNFSYSIALPVNRGLHFYRFKVAGKWDVNRNLPTGVAPTGELMNKVDI